MKKAHNVLSRRVKGLMFAICFKRKKAQKVLSKRLSGLMFATKTYKLPSHKTGWKKSFRKKRRRNLKYERNYRIMCRRLEREAVWDSIH